MPATPLLLNHATDSLWQLFQTDTKHRGKNGNEQELCQRWGRAHERMQRRLEEAGSSPSEAFPEDLSRRRNRLRDLWQAGRDTLDEAIEEFSPHDVSVAIADRDGIILRCLAGGGFANVGWELQLREGADWSEAARGTNAIGTCLIEKRPVAVEGTCHLDPRYHGVAGYAAPILDEDGECVGAIAAVASLPTKHGTALASIIAIACELERRFLERSRMGSREVLLARVREIVERCPTPALLVLPSGRLHAINQGAESLLDLGDRIDREFQVKELLGLGWHELESTARDPRVDAVAHLPHLSEDTTRQNKTRTLASVRLRLQPIHNGSGGVLALLAFLEGPRPPTRDHDPATFLEVGERLTNAEGPFGRIFGRDDRLQAAIQAASRFSPTTLPILLLAETGTGKDLMAHAIHDSSPRSQGPFVPLNCGALSPHLLESELFGYAPGAFTGASRKGREGKIAAAEGGTLFLDEVAEMPAPLQAMLLRVLEDGTYYRVGGNRPRRADIRLICATCEILPDLVAEGGFRKDLYYRIKGACLSLPPLRERTDVGDLTLYLLSRLTEELFPGTYPRIDPEAFDWIQHNSWPGNVRELKTSLHHAAVLARGVIRMEHLPLDLGGIATAPPAADARSPGGAKAPELDLREVESATLRRAISAADGNLSRAAQSLGVARTTLYRKMKRYGIRSA